ncbi:MAG: glycosyltransferase family 2 protein [Bacteroidales bacterium]|nr:glycosyltransferase family 2 protein [Bacteroidales bacterium]
MISVIICTYNRDKYIYGVLQSIALNDYPKSKYEIVLVNNNSTDNTEAEVARFASDYPDVTLRTFVETNQGLSYARNRGIKESGGNILIYVDDDATVNKEYLSGYAAFFEANPDISAAGGPIIPDYEEGEEPEWMTYFIKRLLTAYLYFGDKEREFPGKNYPGGGNAAYRKAVFEKVGLYNVELGRSGGNLGGGEEKDIFNKMIAAGMKFRYIPQPVLYHKIPKYKLEKDYFNRLTCGIGASEKARTLAVSKGCYIKRLFAELIKWGGTLVLWCWYAIQFKPGRGNMLVRFRWNVTRNLL